MRFSKMQGVGNDFVVVDAAELTPGRELPSLAIQLCARQFGVGADGLLIVSRDGAGADLRMRMFNPDGTEDVCGNGLRCVGLWAHRAGWLAGREGFTVMTLAGSRRLWLREVAENGRAATLSVDMGLPKFAPAEIPFCMIDSNRVVGYPLAVGERIFYITAMNTGSTHTVIFGVVPPDEETFQTYSPQIEHHPLFPERTSVLWATPRGDRTLDVRIWERGAGETLGCGTGACAVGVAAQLYSTVGMGNVTSPVEIVSKGGSLSIVWPGAGHSIVMTGPAAFVFEGEADVAA